VNEKRGTEQRSNFEGPRELSSWSKKKEGGLLTQKPFCRREGSHDAVGPNLNICSQRDPGKGFSGRCKSSGERDWREERGLIIAWKIGRGFNSTPWVTL